MSRVSHHFFEHFTSDPDPNEETLDDYRWEWRPLSQNPFIERKSNKKRVSDTVATNPEDPVIHNDAPKWVYLFYDLAWTSTFASLTQNGRFNAPWDTVSYIAFFILMWWVWAAQAMYTIHFYTNDWFHFASNLLQFGIFGALAGTTRGYNIANYIVHSPGSEKLESRPISDIDEPKEYGDEVVAMISIVLLIQYIRIIAYARAVAPKDRYAFRKLIIVPICIVVSIVLFAATWMISVSAAARTPYGAKLKFVFCGAALIVEILSHVGREWLDWRSPSKGHPARNISATCAPGEDYFSTKAARVSKATGDSGEVYSSPDISDKETPGTLGERSPVPEPSSTLLVLPSAERPACEGGKKKLPIPYTNTTLGERLQGVTTIILGEGINGIAGAFWAVISAPGSQRSVMSNAITALVTVCFITYFYFEGPKSRRDPKGLRQIIWLLLHLPFLLAIILLLLGVKDQFLLTSFLSTVLTSLGFPQLFIQEGVNPINPSSGNNTKLDEYLIQRGVKWSEAWQNLTNTLGPIEGGKMNQSQMFDVIAWQWRLALTICLNTFKTFMGNSREIPDSTQVDIDAYYANRTLPILDNRVSTRHGPTNTMTYFKVLTSLVGANATGARYIIGLAGGVLICLSLLNVAHSRPRDRFQWGIILSRFTMGWCLVFLLLLNLGHYQTLWIYREIGQKKHQAGVFQWITVYWALPTIALAYCIELVIETFITGLAKLRRKEVTREDLKNPGRAEAVKRVREARRDGGEVTSEMLQAAKANGRPLRQLAWEAIREGTVTILTQIGLRSQGSTK